MTTPTQGLVLPGSPLGHSYRTFVRPDKEGDRPHFGHSISLESNSSKKKHVQFAELIEIINSPDTIDNIEDVKFINTSGSCADLDSLAEVVPTPNTSLNIQLYDLIQVPENSTLQKILSLIPVIGEYFAYKNETSLEAKIKGAENDAEYKKHLLRIKKCYKGIAIARTVMSVALSFFAAPYTLISLIVKVSSTILGAARIGKAIFDIFKINKELK